MSDTPAAGDTDPVPSPDEPGPADPVAAAVAAGVAAAVARRQVGIVVLTWLRMQRAGWVRWLPGMIAGVGMYASLSGVTAGVWLLVAGLVWSVSQSMRSMRLLQDASALLVPAALSFPKGLDDVRAAIAVLDRADLLRCSRARRAARLREAAGWLGGPDSPARKAECWNGHPEVCAHRTSSDTMSLWAQVAAGG